MSNVNPPSATPTPQRPPTLAERIEQIEKALPRLNEVSLLRTNEASKQFREALGNVVEVVQAIIKLQGDGFDVRIQDEIDAARNAREQAEMLRAKTVLQSLIDQQVLIQSPVITEQSLVVGREFDLEGKPTGTGRAQVEFAQFGEAVQKEFLGQGVGAIYKGPKGSFEVIDIYVQNPNPPKSEETKAADLAVTAAPEPTPAPTVPAPEATPAT